MCTSIRLIAENNSAVYARTLEFGRDTESNIIIIPRNYLFTGTTQSKTPGLTWKSKYAVVGANMLNLVAIVDGLNEKGLAGGLFYFPDYAEYEKVNPDQQQNSIAPWELMTWILTNFGTVKEVKEALPNIRVSNTVFGPWEFVPPLHAIVHDPFGASLVIEYIKGKLVLHDNPLGVITNSPQFDWHLINLSNYINLSSINAKNIQLLGLTVRPLSQGSGMLGLPGDFTSPSRFVRAVAFSQGLVDIKSEYEARNAVFHVLNLFDIPVGVVAEKVSGEITYDYTQWTTAADLKNKSYYWHTYQNHQIYMIDLTKMNLDADKVKIIAMHTKESIVDVTSE